MKIPIAIVDDISQNRFSLSEQILYSGEFDVLFCASNGKEFLELMKNRNLNSLPQVVLMDIEMPEMDGIQAVQHGHLLYPDVKFIMLTVFDDEDKIFEAIRAGANGYLVKDEKISLIQNYMHQVVEVGGVPMSPGIARKAMNLLMNAVLPGKAPEVSYSNSLTEREKEVLKLLVDGFDYKSIGERLFVSGHTVRKHIDHIYQKLHVNSKAQAIKIAGKII